MSSAIGETFKAMYDLWETSGSGVPKNNDLWFGTASQKDNQGSPILAPFAVMNEINGRTIPTMSTFLDDMFIQISCYSDRSQGAVVAQDLCDYAVTIYNRVFLSLGNGYNNAGTLKVASTISYWLEWEKLWKATVTFRTISG